MKVQKNLLSFVYLQDEKKTVIKLKVCFTEKKKKCVCNLKLV